MQPELQVPNEPAGPETRDAGVSAERRPRTAGCHFKECPVCFGQHEEQIHDATLAVRQWFRGEVTKSFDIVYYE
ncbi:MAG: hypothetical protein WBL65_04490 [Bryobacteraceae bacterium]